MTSYKDQLMCHIESMMENSSCHGGNWILKLQDLKTKSAASLFIFLLQSFVIFLLLHSLFVVEKDFTTSIQWKNEDLVYPNITICNPRLFDKEKVRSLNLTDELLAYIFFPLGFDNSELWQSLEEEYSKSSKILESYNLGPNALLSTAISCDNFIRNCRIGRHNGSTNCCEDLFDPKPYFSSKGTCFSTNPQKRMYKSPMDTLVFSINMSSEYSVGINHTTYGPSFAIQAATLVFHSQTHGLAAIDQNTIAINKGSINQIKLSTSRVDRTLLKTTFGEELLSSDDEFAACIFDGSFPDYSQDFGWPAWTEENCEFYTNFLMWSNCSIMQTVGLEPIVWDREDRLLELKNLTYERKVCQAKDLIENWHKFVADNVSFVDRSNKVERLKKNWCHPNCLQGFYQTTVTAGELDPEDQELRDVAIIRVGFQHTSTQVYKMIPETFNDKLSSIGGLMGIIMGASIISIIELLGFHARLIGFTLTHIFRKIKGNTTRPSQF